uniref:Putative DNA repair protein n=1 Tax=viral metagenome TaxID=1070528 RepID=A0A6M3ITM2_9ZZZZ
MNQDWERRDSYKKQTIAIKHLLQRYHESRGNVFCLECRNGSSSPQNPEDTRILDAWAMKPSFVSLTTYGYEIKVARSDFKGDNKWRNYLKYCSFFYFVCPKGLVTLDEIPDEAGYIEVSKNFKCLYRRRRPPRRPIEEPIGMYKYLLINRAKIDNVNVGLGLGRW